VSKETESLNRQIDGLKFQLIRKTLAPDDYLKVKADNEKLNNKIIKLNKEIAKLNKKIESMCNPDTESKKLNTNVKQIAHDEPVKHKLNIAGWTIAKSGKFYRGFKRISGKLHGVYLGSSLEGAEEKIQAKAAQFK
jgi:hypothetical protein